jgi:hypothetical protein
LDVIEQNVYDFIHEADEGDPLRSSLARQVRGLYVQAALQISINELFGIPDTPFFSIKAKIGGGVFGFDRPVYNGLPQGNLSLGAILHGELDGRILYIFTGHAGLLLVPSVNIPPGAPSPSSMTSALANPANVPGSPPLWLLDGKLDFAVKVCVPILGCADASKTLKIRGSYDGDDFKFGLR